MKNYLTVALGAFLAFSGFAAFYMASTALRGALIASDQAQSMAWKISQNSELVYLVTWIEHKCDGLTGRWIPGAVAPYACPAKIQIWRGGDRDRALSRVGENRAATGLRMFEERGPLEKEILLEWKPETKRGRETWH